jgi:hypothetical protein
MVLRAEITTTIIYIDYRKPLMYRVEEIEVGGGKNKCVD